MATDQQIKANRLNALKSTGPSTSEGRSNSSRNAVKHGLLSEGGLLPTEDPEEFARFYEEMLKSYEPRSEYEFHLVSRAVWLMWRLKRIPRIEIGQYLRCRYVLHQSLEDDEQMQDEKRHAADVTKATKRQILHLTSDDAKSNSNSEFVPALAERNIENGYVAECATDRNLEPLIRYEAPLERRLMKIMHELETRRCNGARNNDLSSKAANRAKRGDPNEQEEDIL